VAESRRARAARPSAPRFYVRSGKRLLDLALVVASAPIWIPVAGAVWLIVRCTIGSPVLFRQERPGLYGRPFTLFKFRTMTDAREAGTLLPDAERLTRVGRALRRTSLDELPELVNVLRGDMSLVGPRPLLLHYLALYDAEQRRRHDVRPGLTGLAQVSGRNAIPWSERLALDVWYVDHCGPALDARILLRTVARAAAGTGVSQDGQATVEEFRGTLPRSPDDAGPHQARPDVELEPVPDRRLE
jgi:sugar transferase EpsL